MRANEVYTTVDSWEEGCELIRNLANINSKYSSNWTEEYLAKTNYHTLRIFGVTNNLHAFGSRPCRELVSVEEFLQILRRENSMKLESGDIVVCKNEKVYIVIGDKLVNSRGWMSTKEFNEDFVYSNGLLWNIEKLYRFNDYHFGSPLVINTNISDSEIPKGYKLVWERTQPMKIGDNPVEFTPQGIKVGCTEVSKDQVKEIYDRLFKDS